MQARRKEVKSTAKRNLYIFDEEENLRNCLSWQLSHEFIARLIACIQGKT